MTLMSTLGWARPRPDPLKEVPFVLESCLPATGLPLDQLAIVAAIALVLVVGGIVALRTTKGRVALLLLPLAFIALVFGGASAPAQAYTTAIPSATVSTVWNESGPVLVSDSPSAENAANIDTLFNATDVTESVALTLNGVEYTDAPFWSIFPPTYEIDMMVIDVQDFAITEGMPYGNLPLVLSITYDYQDECGKPLQTVFTYTGTFNFPEPPG